MTTTANFEELISQAGARFVGLVGNSVLFIDPVTGESLRLYTWALRSLRDVELALKSAREKSLDFEPWMSVDVDVG